MWVHMENSSKENVCQMMFWPRNVVFVRQLHSRWHCNYSKNRHTQRQTCKHPQRVSCDWSVVCGCVGATARVACHLSHQFPPGVLANSGRLESKTFANIIIMWHDTVLDIPPLVIMSHRHSHIIFMVAHKPNKDKNGDLINVHLFLTNS